jgi:hypothetical protein
MPGSLELRAASYGGDIMPLANGVEQRGEDFGKLPGVWIGSDDIKLLLYRDDKQLILAQGKDAVVLSQAAAQQLAVRIQHFLTEMHE